MFTTATFFALNCFWFAGIVKMVSKALGGGGKGGKKGAKKAE